MVDITPKDRSDWDEDEPEATARLREVFVLSFSLPSSAMSQQHPGGTDGDRGAYPPLGWRST